MGRKAIDITGMKFYRWTVLSRADSVGNKSAKWNCVCDCGKRGVVEGTKLRNGGSKSCGCRAIENIKRANTTHGLSDKSKNTSPVYGVWSKMKNRCCWSGSSSYHRYGGRGISICDEWLNDFQAFHDWAMSSGYREGLQIDRIDNDGGYCPENCRWVTVAENSRNRSTSKLNAEKVKKIRAMINSGFPREDIANRFNVSKYTIRDIAQGLTWAGV